MRSRTLEPDRNTQEIKLLSRTDCEEEIACVQLRITSLERKNADLTSRNIVLERQLLTAKIAFADSVIGKFASVDTPSSTYAEMVRKNENCGVAAALVAELMDVYKDPTPQTVTQKENSLSLSLFHYQQRSKTLGS